MKRLHFDPPTAAVLHAIKEEVRIEMAERSGLEMAPYQVVSFSFANSADLGQIFLLHEAERFIRQPQVLQLAATEQDQDTTKNLEGKDLQSLLRDMREGRCQAWNLDKIAPCPDTDVVRELHDSMVKELGPRPFPTGPGGQAALGTSCTA